MKYDKIKFYKEIFDIINDYYDKYYYVLYEIFSSEIKITIKNLNEIKDEFIELLHDELNEIEYIKNIEIYSNEIIIKVKI